MLLKTHLDIISRNEPIQRKARFWQSYVRALKGTEDIKAPENSRTPRSIYRPIYSEFPELSSKLDTWPLSKSLYEDPAIAHERISSPGYRYQPISRETYGYSPRNFLYRDPIRIEEKKPKALPNETQAWNDHMERMAAMGRLAPFRRSMSPPPRPSLRARSASPVRARSASPFERASSPFIRESSPFTRSTSPSPILGYTYAGYPIYTRDGISRPALVRIMSPSPYLSAASVVRDPWWYAYPELKPFETDYVYRTSPSYLRRSYLSPVKNRYLWNQHPVRPF
ncbi:uncharacterized protein Mf [Cloeon dipterum]|uniref:uncharacterized protein Mf n=1 Tax=Cloeon dipterum TaxID=197152 RepID=UPI0032205A36